MLKIINKRFQPLSKLGEGGMGEVYLALDKELNRRVAIKVLKEAVPKDTDVFRRTLSEGKILSTLRHESLASVYEVNMDGSTPHIVQEYIEGQTLREFLSKGYTLQIDKGWQLLREQAQVLTYLHQQNVIHRDIKPDNIMLTPSGKSILMDFGLAIRPDHTRITEDGAFVGTLLYCPPETIKGEAPSPSADVYQLCLVIYECITGKSPIGTVRSPVEFVELLLKSDWSKKIEELPIPENLRKILLQGTSINPRERPSNGSALLAIIDECYSPQVIKKNRDAPPGGETKVHLHKNKRTSLSKGKSKTPDKKETSDFPSSKSLKDPAKKRSLRILSPIALLLLTILAMVAGTTSFHKIPSATMKATSIIRDARAFVLFPHGVYLFLPMNSGKALSWKINKVADRSEKQDSVCNGNLERAPGGWKLFLRSEKLTPGQEFTLSIFDKEQRIASKTITIPENLMKKPLEAKFSYDSIITTWELNGFCPLTLVYTGKSSKNKHLTPITVNIPKNTTNNKVDLSDFPYGEEIELSLNVSGMSDFPVQKVTGKLGFDVLYQMKPDSSTENLSDKISIARTLPADPRMIIFQGVTNDHLFVVSRTGRIYCFKRDGTGASAYTLLWERDLSSPQFSKDVRLTKDGEIGILATSIRTCNEGIELFGLGTGNTVYAFSIDGSSSKRTLPQSILDEFKTVPLSDKVVRVHELDGSLYFSVDQGSEERSYCLSKTGGVKKISHNGGNVAIGALFQGLSRKFAWIWSADHQAIVELTEEENKVKTRTIVKASLSRKIFCYPTMVFDDSTNCGLLSLDKRLYSIIKNKESLKVKEVGLNLDISTTVSQILNCGNGRFLFPAGKFISEKPVFQQYLSRLKICETVFTDGIAESKIFDLGTNTMLRDNAGDFRTIGLLNDGKIMFSARTSFLIVDPDDYTIKFEENFSAALSNFHRDKDFVLCSKIYSGTLLLMHLNK